MDFFDIIKKGLLFMSLCFICLGQAAAQNVAKNATAGTEYTTLQAAIGAASDGDSIVVLTDLTTNSSIDVNKSLVINGCKHLITISATRGLCAAASNKNIKVKNLTFDFTGSGIEGWNIEEVAGFQINAANIHDVNLVIDSCRITGRVITQNFTDYPIPSYGLFVRDNTDNNTVTVTNSYLWGRAAANCWGPNTKFTFVNDTLYGVNTQSGSTAAFGTIVLDGGASNSKPKVSSDTVRLVHSVVIAERQTGADDEMWIYIPNGAYNCAVYADENTEFLNRGDANTTYSDVYIDERRWESHYGTWNSVNMYNLPAAEIQKLKDLKHTVIGPDENGLYRISHNILYYVASENKYYHSDFDYHFPAGDGDKIYLKENVTMTQSNSVPDGVHFSLYFTDESDVHSITQGDYSIVLAGDAACTTDKQALNLFSSVNGHSIIETDNGDNTYTYSVAPDDDDCTAHNTTTMTIADINKQIMYGCDTIIRDFGTPAFAFTNPDFTEAVVDTFYNNVATVAPDSVFPIGTTVITWTAVDTCGHSLTATQDVVISFMPCPTAIDGNSNEYQTLRAGCYCWMAENLRSTVYSDGLREIKNVMQYPVNTRAADPNGNLYDWYAVMDTATNSIDDIENAYANGKSVQGICPKGWHVPTSAELENLMSTYEPQDLMSEGWAPDNGTNASGFNLLPSGSYNSTLNRYERRLASAYFWILTPPTTVYHACAFGAACSTFETIPGSLTMGYSVRCVKNE